MMDKVTSAATTSDEDGGAPLGVAVVGCGGAAVDVVRALRSVPGVRVVGAMDRDPALAADLVRGTGARIHATLDAVLADPDVDIVYIALPHDLLAVTALRAVEAGRHVLVEKPVAPDVDTIEGLARAADARGVSVGVMFELRYTPAVLAARELVRSGAIGTIRAVRVVTVIDKPDSYWREGLTGRSRDSWRASLARAGGGILLMNTIHQLDILDSILGLAVVRVTADMTAGIVGVEVEDVAAATLRLADGGIVSIAASAHSAGATADERIEIDGTDGSIRLHDPYRDPDLLEVFLRRHFGDLSAGTWHVLRTPPGDPFAAALQAFADAVRSGTRPAVGTAEAARTVAVVLAMYRAAAAGPDGVTVPDR